MKRDEYVNRLPEVERFFDALEAFEQALAFSGTRTDASDIAVYVTSYFRARPAAVPAKLEFFKTLVLNKASAFRFDRPRVYAELAPELGSASVPAWKVWVQGTHHAHPDDMPSLKQHIQQAEHMLRQMHPVTAASLGLG